MSAPSGVLKNRWNQAVSGISGQMGWTTAQSDAWLNTVWAGLPFVQNIEDKVAADRLAKWAAANTTGQPTLPCALINFLT